MEHFTNLVAGPFHSWTLPIHRTGSPGLDAIYLECHGSWPCFTYADHRPALGIRQQFSKPEGGHFIFSSTNQTIYYSLQWKAGLRRDCPVCVILNKGEPAMGDTGKKDKGKKEKQKKAQRSHKEKRKDKRERKRNQ